MSAKKITWMWISKTTGDTAQFRRLRGPSLRDLFVPGMISMGLVILSWIADKYLLGAP